MRMRLIGVFCVLASLVPAWGLKKICLADFEKDEGKFTQKSGNEWKRIKSLDRDDGTKSAPSEGNFYLAYDSKAFPVGSSGTVTSTEPIPGDTETCIHFDYIMYNTLRGAAFQLIILNAKNDQELLVAYDSQQGTNAWGKNSTITVEPVKMPYKLRIRAVSFDGDIGVDNVCYSIGPCQLPDGPKHLFASFETIIIDKFRKMGSMEWVRATERKKAFTGPDKAYKDHFFLHIDSDYAKPNMEAILMSPIAFTGDEKICVRFAYHMDGKDIGDLRIRIVQFASEMNATAPGNKSKVIWTEKKVDPKWRIADLEIDKQDWPYKVSFVGRANGKLGDVAIDDVLMGPAPCKYFTVGKDCMPCNISAVQTIGCRVANKDNVAFCQDVGHAPDSIIVKQCNMTAGPDANNNTIPYRRCLITPCDDGSNKVVKTLLYESMCSDMNGQDCDACCPEKCVGTVVSIAQSPLYNLVLTVTGTLLGLLYATI